MRIDTISRRKQVSDISFIRSVLHRDAEDRIFTCMALQAIFDNTSSESDLTLIPSYILRKSDLNKFHVH
jgi:hypothetical protein